MRSAARWVLLAAVAIGGVCELGRICMSRMHVTMACGPLGAPGGWLDEVSGVHLDGGGCWGMLRAERHRFMLEDAYRCIGTGWAELPFQRGELALRYVVAGGVEGGPGRDLMSPLRCVSVCISFFLHTRSCGRLHFVLLSDDFFTGSSSMFLCGRWPVHALRSAVSLPPACGAAAPVH